MGERSWLLSSKLFRVLLGIVLSVLSVYLASRNVDYRNVWAAVSKADMWFVGLALGSVTVNTLAKAIRWKWLMGMAGRNIRLSQFLRALLIGQLLNNVVPVRVGELSRVYLIGNLGPGKIFTLGTIVLEKLFDMLLYVLLFVLLVLLVRVPTWVSQPAYPFALITLSSFATVMMLAYRQEWLLRGLSWATSWLPQQIRETLIARIDTGVSSLSILQSRSSNFRLGWSSALIWGTAVLNNILVLHALHIDAPAVSALLVLIVLQAGISIPSMPGKIGIFEYLCVLALGVFAVDRTLALSYGFLLHAIVFLPTSIAGLVCWWGSGLPNGQPVAWETATKPR